MDKTYARTSKLKTLFSLRTRYLENDFLNLQVNMTPQSAPEVTTDTKNNGYKIDKLAHKERYYWPQIDAVAKISTR